MHVGDAEGRDDKEAGGEESGMVRKPSVVGRERLRDHRRQAAAKDKRQSNREGCQKGHVMNKNIIIILSYFTDQVID